MKTYSELLQTFPPRPIKSEEGFLATQQVIDSLIDQNNGIQAPPFNDSGGRLCVIVYT